MASFDGARSRLGSVSRRLRPLLTAAAAAAYAITFLSSYPFLGELAGALIVLPAAVAGWLHGRWIGLVAGIFGLAVNTLLYMSVSDVAVAIHASVPTAAAAALVGGAVGYFSELVRDRRTRRAASRLGATRPERAASITFDRAGAAGGGVAAVPAEPPDLLRPFFELHPALASISLLSSDAVLEANSALLRALGLSRADVVGKTAHEIGLWADAGARARFLAELRKRRAVTGVEFRGRIRTGESRVFIGSASLAEVGGESYVLESAVELANDGVTRGEKSEARAEPTLRSDPALLLVTRLDDGTVVDVSDSLLALIGTTRDQLLGRVAQLGPLADPARRATLLGLLERQGNVPDVEFQIRDRAGTMRDVVGSIARLDVGRARCVVTSAVDITERKRRERHIAQRAFHDELSGLPNRAFLRERLEQAIRSARAASVLVVDLRRFSEMNEAFGDTVGDELLRLAGARLGARVREGDTVGRLGADEFGIVLPGTGPAVAREAAVALLNALRSPFASGALRLGLDARIGSASYPEHGEDAESIMRRAEVAVRAAKRSGSRYAEFVPGIERRSDPEASLLADLADAIASGRLSLEYQPEIEVRTGRVSAVNALVRWPHPTRGLLGAGDFVPLAERAGLARALTRWALEAALIQFRAWREQALDLRISVNLTAPDLAASDLADTVGSLLASKGVAPSSLLLEIPERALSIDPRHPPIGLEGLRRLGVALTLDDLGTASSPFAHLERLGISHVKIAGGIVREIRRSQSQAAFVRAATLACHAAGCSLGAQEIEDEETLRLVREIGCDTVLGHLFARPMPPTEVQSWMSRMSGSDLAGLRQRLAQGSRARSL